MLQYLWPHSRFFILYIVTGSVIAFASSRCVWNTRRNDFNWCQVCSKFRRISNTRCLRRCWIYTPCNSSCYGKWCCGNKYRCDFSLPSTRRCFYRYFGWWILFYETTFRTQSQKNYRRNTTNPFLIMNDDTQKTKTKVSEP